jgi:serine/threonine-protein kinase
MGRVELAMRRSGTFTRLYAVKRLHPHLRGDGAMRSMFLDEGRVAGLLRHANVVAVLDVGEDEDGPFLVMDYVDGVSLDKLLKHRALSQELLPIDGCAQILAQVARGLHTAHELTAPDGTPLNLVHRDVSPQNILIGRDGVARMSDFGIAKALGQSSRTSTGLLKGKAGYMSPEQLRFEQIDRRSDLFALGVVLFEVLTLRRLYKGEDGSAVARRILGELPPDLGDERSDAPPALVELCFELLGKDPRDRPETAAEVAERLEQVRADYDGTWSVAEDLQARFGEQLEARERLIEASSKEVAMVGALGHTQERTAVSHSILSASRRRRRRARVVLASVSAAAMIAAILIYGVWPSSAAPGDTAVPGADADEVVLYVESQPDGARVRVGSDDKGSAPVSISLPRGAAPLILHVDKEGYQTAEQELDPAADGRVLVVLSPTEPAYEGTSEPVAAQPRVETPAAADASGPASAPSPPSRQRKSKRQSRRHRADDPATSPEQGSPFRRFD